MNTPTTGKELNDWLVKIQISQRQLAKLLSDAAGTSVCHSTVNSQITRGLRLTPLMRAALSGLVASGALPPYTESPPRLEQAI